MTASFRGQLLVASPSLEDPNFVRTVVLLLAHGDEGALGIVLNRPMGAPVYEVLPQWHDLAIAPSEVFRGGPVAESAAICLAHLRVDTNVDPDQIGGLEPAVAALVSVDLNRDPDHFGSAIAGLRVFTGYAGWTGGQLEAELELGGWILTDVSPHDPLTPDPESLWADVLRHQGGLRAAYATAPPKLSLN